MCIENNYTFRLATEMDCDELSKLKHAVWETTYRGIYSDEKIDNYDYEKNKNKFIGIVNNPELDLYVAMQDGKIIGYLEYGTPIRPFENYQQEIGLLYILKEFQGVGIGRKLFNMAYDTIKEKGYKDFFVSCNKYNTPAQKFYERMGGQLIHTDDDNEDKSIPQVVYLYEVR